MLGASLRRTYLRTAGLTAVGGAGYLGWSWWNNRLAHCEALEVDGATVPRPTRTVNGWKSQDQDFHVTLFQYQTCPFCSKVRAFFDYYGLAYDVVEVNPLFRTEVKFSKYKKIPFVLYSDKKEHRVQNELVLPDSSLIVSLMRTAMMRTKNDKESIKSYLDFYPEVESAKEVEKGKKDFANKYEVMFEEELNNDEQEARTDESQWRKWVDDKLVHTLAPNIYRSPGEAVRTFKYLAEAGEWERIFPAWQVPMVIYVGASTMWLIAKRLKKRYQLADDVRISMYEACDEWVKAVGKQKFLGGNQPNLADLAAFGVLNAIEGCEAFADLAANTQILPWYQRVKVAVRNHEGVDNGWVQKISPQIRAA